MTNSPSNNVERVNLTVLGCQEAQNRIDMAPCVKYRKWLEMWRNGQGRHYINVCTGHPRWEPLKCVKGQRGATGKIPVTGQYEEH